MSCCNNKNKKTSVNSALTTSGVKPLVKAIVYATLIQASAIKAGPTGGNIVGGAGSISQSGLNTTINQNTSSLAIDWQSFSVNVDERVQFTQPSSSAIALNRILGSNASQINGRIDANGQIVLVNPQGIFFGQNASVNVGGLIASGLAIDPVDFMNGNYLFNAIEDTDGLVINSGVINASLGGSVSLIGQQVSNEGLISANLGAVNLAAGKQAILSFDVDGLMGVRVTKEIIQDELGLDPAVLNTGEISASGGRVLLTGSVSQDIFSQAVNTGNIEQATSVVVHEDGTFTLGAGADVVNSGAIDVSTSGLNQDAGQVVVLGENVTNSGVIAADALNANGGDIELHSVNNTFTTENSLTSARSENNGEGGIIKVLGDKVALFDQSVVDASGANGGGEVLIGGDQEGKNTLIRNAEVIYLDENTSVKADALDNGNGGKIISFADHTAYIYGSLSAQGGINGGNGGFIETSGLYGFYLTSAPEISAYAGMGGTWLIDPYNITITNDVSERIAFDTDTDTFTADAADAFLNIGLLLTQLSGGNTIIVRTSAGTSEEGNITFNGDMDFNTVGNSTLVLDAYHNILFQTNSSITDSTANAGDSLNLSLLAGGSVTLEETVSINTGGGNFIVGDEATGNLPTDFNNHANNTIITEGGFVDIYAATVTSAGNINTTGSADTHGGRIDINSVSGSITSNSLTSNGGIASNIGTSGFNAGNTTLTAINDIQVNGTILAQGSQANDNNNSSSSYTGGSGGNARIETTSGNITLDTSSSSTPSIAIITNGGQGDANDDGSGDIGNGGTAGYIELISQNGAGDISLGGNLFAQGGAQDNNGRGSNGAGNYVTLNGHVILTNSIEIDTTIVPGSVSTDSVPGKIDFRNGIVGSSDRAETLTLNGGAIDLDGNIGQAVRLGAIDITATGNVGDAATGNIFADSFTVNSSTSFRALNINTVGANDTDGGLVSIDSSGSIVATGINTQGGVANDDINGVAGGDISLISTLSSTTAGITINGLVSANGSNGGTATTATDTTGGDAGSISLTANNGRIVINGDITSEGGTGADGTDSDSDPGASGGNNSITIDGRTVRTTGIRTITGGLVDLKSTNSLQLRDSLTLTATNAGTFVTTNANDVLVNADINYDSIGANKTLAINADDDITVNGISDEDSSVANQLTVNLQADSDDSDSGRIEIVETISTGGGAFTANAYAFEYWNEITGSGINGNILTNGGDVDIDSVFHLYSRQNITSSGGAINIDVTNGYFDNDYLNGTISSANGSINITAQGVTTNPNCNGCGAWLGSLNTTTGSLNINTSAGNGHIHQDNETYLINIGGTTTLNAGTGNIELDNASASVDFVDAVTLTANNSTISDINSILLGTATIGNTLSITAENGGITQAATTALDVNGVASFASTDGVITLDNNGIDFTGQVNDFTGAVNIDNTGGNAVTIRDSNDYTLGTTSLTGGLYTVNAGNDITLPNTSTVDTNGSSSSLTLNANNNININNQPLSGGGSLALSFNSDADISTAGQINLNANISTGGSDVIFDGAVILHDDAVALTTTTNTIDVGTGKIHFNSTVDGKNDREQSLTLTAGDIDFHDNVGSNTRLGNISITATGDVVAATDVASPIPLNITAHSLNVTASNSFAAGNIDTVGAPDNAGGSVTINATTTLNTGTIDTSAGDATIDSNGSNGGSVSLSASNYSTNTITSVGGDAFGGTGTGGNTGGDGGLVTFTAVANAGNKSIAINGDIDVRGGRNTDNNGTLIDARGTSQTAQITLDDAGSTSGEVHLNYVGVFTSNIAITGSNDSDLLFGADNATNNWTIDSAGGGNLNSSNITFLDMERLIGGNADDNFVFDVNGTLSGGVTGSSSGNDGAYNTLSLAAKTDALTWQLTNSNEGTVNNTGGFSDIQEIIGGSGTDTLTGYNVSSVWTLDNNNQGFVAELVAPANRLNFSNIENLTGHNDAIDNFIITSNGSLGGLINGGTGTGVDSLEFLITDGSNNNWVITGPDTGRLVGVINTSSATPTTENGFVGIESVKGNNDTDIFTITNSNFISNVHGGDDITFDLYDTVDFSGLSSEFTVNLGSNTGFVNIEIFSGNSLNPELGTLAAENVANTWNIDGQNTGTINGFRFTDFANLRGGTVEDIFNFSDDNVNRGTISGLIDGVVNAGTQIDTINLYLPANLSNGAVATPVTVQLEGVAGSAAITNGYLDVLNISQINANISVTNSLRGGNGTNIWSMNGSSSGVVNGINFDGFSILAGGTGNDTLSAAALIEGNTWDISSNYSGNLNTTTFTGMEVLNGNTTDDTFTLSTNVSNGNFNGGAGTGIDTLNAAAEAAGNTWDVSSDYTGTLNTSLVFSGMEILNGNSTSDLFNLAAIVNNGTFNGGSGTGIDTITLLNGASTNANIWEINENVPNTINTNISFNEMENLYGNNGLDQFNLNHQNFTGLINGFDGYDIITASSDDNDWIIDTLGGGSVTDSTTGASVDFISIEELIGNTGIDTFTFINSGDIAGIINGGSSISQDVVDLSGLAVADVTIGSVISNTGINIVDIEHVIGNTDNSTIRGEAISGLFDQNSWVIFDDLTETNTLDLLINDGTVTNENGEVKFNNFSNIIGSNRDDSFMFTGEGGVDMSIAGGTENVFDNNDRIDYSNLTGIVPVRLGEELPNGITFIDGVTGNNTSSYIYGISTQTNTWTINGNNDGEVISGDERLIFVDFNFLIAGNQGDSFDVESGGSIGTIMPNNTVAGYIQGGNGNDVLNITLTGAENNLDATAYYGVNFIAGDGSTDVVNLIGNNTSYDTAEYSVNNTDASATHTFADNDSRFAVTYTGVEEVNDDVEATTLIINGTQEQDNINFEHNATNHQFTLTSNPSTGSINYTTVDYSNKTNVVIDAGSSNADLLLLTGISNLGAGDISIISAETVNRNSALYGITANTILLDGVVSMGSNTSAFIINANTLDIENSSNASTSFYIRETDSVTLAGINSQGLLNLTANNNITNSADLVSSADIALTSSAGNIELLGVNGLAAGLSLIADVGSITLENAVLTTLDFVSTATLDITSTAGITDSGTGTVIATNAIFDAGANTIDLSAALNAFDTLAITNAQSASIRDNDTDGLLLNNINLGSGTLSITSNEIIQATNSTITQNSNAAGTAGAVTFNAAGLISLDENNQFIGTVSLNNTGANNIAIRDIDNIRFATSTLGSGSFTVNAVGISQTGAITQQANAGNVVLNAGNGNILLNNAANDFTGDVLLTTLGTPNSTLGNVTLVDTDTLQLGSSSVGGMLNATALSGGLSQSGALTVSGDALFAVANAESIYLLNTANNFQQGISFAATSGQLLDVSIANNAGFDLGNINVSRHLIVDANGAISNSGVLNVGMVASIDANGNNINLTNAANDFNDIVLGSANNVDIYDVDDINLGVRDSNNPSNVTFNQLSNIANDLTITTSNGSITDVVSHTLNVGGSTTLNAGTNNIDLSAGTNDFNSLHIVSANNVNATDINGVAISSDNIYGNLDIQVNGNISNGTEALNVTGTSSLTYVGNTSADIILDNTNNTLQGAISLNATSGEINNVYLSNTASTNIDLLHAANDLTIVSAGEINDGISGVVTVGNQATLTASSTAGDRDIILNNTSNNFNRVTVVAADNVDIYGITGLALDNINVSGNAIFTANDSIIQNAPIISANGNVTIASGQDIIMNNNSSTQATQGNVEYTASNNVTLGQIDSNTAQINATNGQIIDGNGASVNLAADRVELAANNGIIGLETQASTYFIENQSGVINLNNTGELTIERLHNSGDITLINDLTVTINPGSVNADRTTGTLHMEITNGSILGGGSLDLSNPDITAQNATLFAFQGNIGSFGRPLVLDVPGNVLFQARSSIRPFFSPDEPTNFTDDSLQQLSSFDTVSALSGQQLVEVETLSEVDPAIFTNVNNYSMGEISIRMPRDQLYEDEEENDNFERLLQ